MANELDLSFLILTTPSLCVISVRERERGIHWKRHFLLAPSRVTQQRLFVYKGPNARLENLEVINPPQANTMTALNSAGSPK